MKLYHGTNNWFDEFDTSKVLSSEGIAKRGWGINLTETKYVADFYFKRTNAKSGYILEVETPDLNQFIDLNASISDMPIDAVSLIKAFHLEFSGKDLNDLFEEAQEHEDASYSYPTDRAEDYFDKLILGGSNEIEAIEELLEFSEGYDWGRAIEEIEKATLGLYEDATGEDFYQGLKSHAEFCGIPESKMVGFLKEHGLVGTYGKETIGSNSIESDTKSFVVFSSKDAKIVSHNPVGLEKEISSDYDYHP